MILNLLPQISWIGQTVTAQHKVLDPIGIMVNEAAAAAISAKLYSTALEWLEQGCAIVWKQFSHLHTQVGELHYKEPILAMKLIHASKALENASNYVSSYEDLSAHSNYPLSLEQAQYFSLPHLFL